MQQQTKISGQSNLTKPDCHCTQTVQSYLPGGANMQPIGIHTIPVLSPAESLQAYRPLTCPDNGRLPSWFYKKNQIFANC